MRNLFLAAVELQAKAVVIVDADLTSFTPKWIQRLGEPLFNDFDYVSPIYERHKYDASITNHFARPLLQALYGLRISEPIGGDFGFSGKAAMAFLSEKLWTDPVAHFGIDLWMTTLAYLRGLKVCETFLGSCKSHRVKDPARELSTMFQDVIATLLDLMVPFEYLWKQEIRTRTVEEINALNTMKKDFKVTVSTLPPEEQKKMMNVAMKQWDKVAAKDAPSAKAVSMLKDFLKKLDYID